MFFSKKRNDSLFFISLLHSKVTKLFLNILCPTLDFNPGSLSNIPVVNFDVENKTDIIENSRALIEIAKNDWNSFEIACNFEKSPLLYTNVKDNFIDQSFLNWQTFCKNQIKRMLDLEADNNNFFIEAYSLKNELHSEVSLSEITLFCNPHYRYGDKKTEFELKCFFQTDTIKELISYAIGCMMGRYSLDHPGLIYAHSGNIDFDPSKYKTFPADDDGIIPIMDQEWFEDDATNRFVEFLKVAWTPETLDENLKFVADSLSPKKNETSVDTIRRYISTNFFKDHLKTYKKRPIYWLFSSGKQKAFQCLVYLHRYNESTLARMRSAYVTPLQGNFVARIEFLQRDIDAESTASAKRKFQKEINSIQKKLEELRKFDDELRHYSEMKISLDLDDGVKVNYGKFGNLLAEKNAVTGKE